VAGCKCGWAGFDLSLSGIPISLASVNTVSGASYANGITISSESIAAIFGNGMASTTATAPPNAANELPTMLGDITLTVRDANGTTRNAPLFYVAPTQINAQIPAGTSLGTATLTALQNGTSVAQGTVAIETVSPGIFAANADGKGLAAAVIQRVRGDGTQSYEPVAQYDATQQKLIARPIDLGPATDQIFLILFGTGFRAHFIGLGELLNRKRKRRSVLCRSTKSVHGIGSSEHPHPAQTDRPRRCRCGLACRCETGEYRDSQY
jgi:uncharacterized protein (TIGR03437 family)